MAAGEGAVLLSGAADHWPADPEVVERVGLRSCARRRAAITLVADQSRESRTQLVFTQARGRDAVFWQSPRTRKTARAAGLARLEIVVDSHERYPYRFAAQQVDTVRRAMPAGDYLRSYLSSPPHCIGAIPPERLAILASRTPTRSLRPFPNSACHHGASHIQPTRHGPHPTPGGAPP